VEASIDKRVAGENGETIGGIGSRIGDGGVTVEEEASMSSSFAVAEGAAGENLEGESLRA
jgi:hypothetical protein